MDRRLEELGASRFVPRIDVNKEDWKAVHSWIDSVVAQLASLPLKTIDESRGILPC